MPLVLTGVNSALGVSGRNGIELAARDLNESGGIKGRPVELLVRDDGDDPRTALAVDKELAAQGVLALVGHMTSKTGIETIPWCETAELVLVSPTISSSGWSGKDDYFFRVIGSNELQGEVLARDALARGLRSGLIFYETGNEAFTLPVARAFARVFGEGGGRLVSLRPFTAAPTLDHARLAAEARASGADLVLFSASAFDLALFCQALAKSGPMLAVYGPMWASTADLFVQGGHSVEGARFAAMIDAGSRAPAYLKFRSDYRETYGEEPGFGAVLGYDAMTMLGLAARRASRLDGPSLKASLLAGGGYPGLQSAVGLDAYGDCTRPYSVVEARGGAFSPVQ